MTKRDELHVINGNLTVVTVDDEEPVETVPLAKREPFVVESIKTEPFGGKGDHDDNGTVGGAHAPVDEPVAPEQPAAPKRRGRPSKKR
jgi:hypothetical protein